MTDRDQLLTELRRIADVHEKANRYLTTVSWLRQAADEIEALRAALATQPEPGIPIYAMLDVWMALGGDPAAFDRMWAEPHRTPADTWAQLMAAVGQRLGSLAADTNPPIGPEFDRLIFPAAALRAALAAQPESDDVLALIELAEDGDLGDYPDAESELAAARRVMRDLAAALRAAAAG